MEKPDHVDSILSEPNGLVTFEAADLPPAYARRIADRRLRASFRQRARNIGSPQSNGSRGVRRAERAPGAEVRRAAIPAETIDYWERTTAAIPDLRGFRAPLLDDSDEPWPFGLAADERPAVRRAATFVARELASLGLVETTMRVMQREKLSWLREGRIDRSLLRKLGLPTDLLRFFEVDVGPADSAIAAWLSSGADPERLRDVSGGTVFRFEPSCRDFAVMPEDGSRRVATFRTQLAAHQYELGERDGSFLDVIRQLAEGGHDADVLVSVEDTGVDSLIGELASRRTSSTGVIVVPTNLPVTSWAQDNGKAGSAPAPNDGAKHRVVTLVPRYASWGEVGPTFAPGDSFVFETLNREWSEVIQSPLLFQGGDIIPVVNPRDGCRLLLVGEGVVHMNRALGLTQDEVLDALRLEFGVDRVEVLPAISYHLDLELTVRRHENNLIAFVNDDRAASWIILHRGIRAMEQQGLLSAGEASSMLEAWRQEKGLPLVVEIWKQINRYRDRRGRFRQQFLSTFATSTVESSSANALRFLLALDIITSASLSERELAESGESIEIRRYLGSMQVRASERAAMVSRLSELGFDVRPVPSLSDEEASINYLNGVHTTSSYLMPVFGGFYSALDQEAGKAFSAVLSEQVSIRPIRSAAVQARYGGLHCMVSVYPGPPGAPT